MPQLGLAIAHPWPGPGSPIILLAGIGMSSMNTSLTSDVPVISRSGRTVMPGIYISQMIALMPFVLRRIGIGACQQLSELRPVPVGLLHFLAGDAVHVTVQHCFGAQQGLVITNIGLGEELAPLLLPSRDRWKVVCPLHISAVSDQGLGGKPAGTGDTRHHSASSSPTITPCLAVHPSRPPYSTGQSAPA